jgi:hypothetical protein
VIVATFSDRALSGASIHRREGIKELLGAARSGAFDIVIAESMSRIGRDQEDRAGIRKRLQFANVRLATPVDGIVSSLTDGIRAVIDSQQLEDLKHQIRRGMEGVVRDGRHAGGRAYGYRAVPGKPGGTGDCACGGRDRSSYLRALSRWRDAAADRARAKCGEHSAAPWRVVGLIGDTRQLQAQEWHSAK